VAIGDSFFHEPGKPGSWKQGKQPCKETNMNRIADSHGLRNEVEGHFTAERMAGFVSRGLALARAGKHRAR
jgi:hypothetical protein